MRLKEDQTEQKLRGAYYTPLKLAKTMVDFFKTDTSIQSILEPSFGDGVFLDALMETGFLTPNRNVTAVEIEPKEAEKVAKKFQSNPHVSVLNQDFFKFYQTCKDRKQYDLILGNPPYIRFQYLEGRMEMAELLTSHGMKANPLINAWVGFLVACVHMLSNNGKIAFVLPAEILQVSYAEDLRLFLSNQLSKITLLTFQELIFPNVTQEVVVLIGEKGNSETGIRVIEFNNLDDLDDFHLSETGFQKLSPGPEKWTTYLRTESENRFLLTLTQDPRFQRLSETGLIQVGITTGNNSYFSVDQKTVETYDLSNVVRPLIGRSSHADGVFFTDEDWNKNAAQGKTAYLIDFSDTSTYTQGQKEYLELGKKRDVPTGYKCRIRKAWYQVPSVWAPDAFFLRKSHRYPKFVLNDCGAVSTDTMHRIKFHKGIEPERILLSYYNSISFAFTEICGKSLGGGVLELLPKEAGSILVPILDHVPMKTIREILHQVDEMIRSGEEIEQVLNLVDQRILMDYLEIEKETCSMARGIFLKMQHRRLKRGSRIS